VGLVVVVAVAGFVTAVDTSIVDIDLQGLQMGNFVEE